MVIGIIDEAQRKVARIAGMTFLLTTAIVVAVNFAINARLLAVSNPAGVAHNILAHECLFRLGIAGNLVYAAGLMVLLSALHVTLRPVNRGLALRAAIWRLAYAATPPFGVTTRHGSLKRTLTIKFRRDGSHAPRNQ